VVNQSGPEPAEKPITVIGISRMELAKIGGMTPAVFSFKGRCELSPPVILLPCWRLGYWTMIRRWAEQTRLTDKLQVVNDALPMLFCATPDGCGVALISGTGSLAYGRREDGMTARAGGWGYLFGDEGSAYGIAVEGLRAVAKCTDGRGPATRLQESFLAALGGIRAQDLITVIYDPKMTRSQIAELCPLVFEAQQASDPVATQIVETAACQLAETIAAVALQLGYETRRFPLALTGGVLLHNREMRNRLESALRHEGIIADPITTIPNPVAGALSISQQSLLSKSQPSLPPPITGLLRRRL
jgi:N-acetylglucosamine kinase-like BadF-type ATPase